ncbi:1-deoxy-D-xylulose-5-phosphate synthase [Thermosulfidibacter takaii ABI70S6]|uniref:1-deoxy-D-xylulose-5-phosphate synthase n=1 Tax=Thermosulfidibacter takaii (strain DSM 17441 / JCM 13301 / NBRC 103674 / ABI70S6) TaxID=1298851 RepID=A0A0S3QW03_THET7|nr:1-deoxy-D-xylulose-5-phosphate synthase [Thermosulfidibacter takaii ABI70S6]
MLAKIDSPSDIKNLSVKELEKLAQEIREFILQVVSKTGGHLAPSLGVVELTIALHYVFNSPKDKIIWDVGHQSYVHKILTGRKKTFVSLRQKGGISGFPKRSESEHDIFGTGHASTAISAALGIATARDLKGEDFKVIAVVGDGALTGGLAWEALNHAGDEERDLIVVLNDNEFSISPTGGALSHYLSRRLADPTYLKVREEVKKYLETKPGGESILSFLKRMEESFKGFFTPGVLFEELGFRYVGPVRGHKLRELVSTFRQVKKTSGPILVHVLTKKGKGYEPAERDPRRFHGVGPFDIETGKSHAKTNFTYTKAFSDSLIKIAERDPKVMAITAAMPDGTGLAAFAERFPERFFDVGIAEQHAVVFAAGLATQGLKPVCAIYSTFLQRAYDQIIHDVALQKLPVVFAIDRAGIVGEDGPTHHGVFDLSYLRHIPDMVVSAPKDQKELAYLLYTALNQNKPFAIRYPKGEAPGKDTPQEFEIIPVGSWELLREGSDVLILATGNMVYEALKASEELEREGLSVAVVNARFVKPLDEEMLLDLVSSVGKIVTVEDNVLAGGFGSAVCETLVDRGVSFKGVRLGIPDIFVPHGKASQLRKDLGLDAEGIKEAVKKLMS